MTLAQAKRIVRFLLDAEVYFQYEHKLNTFFDLGQKRIACTTDFIQTERELTVAQKQEVDLVAMDPLFYRLKRVEGGAFEKLSATRIELAAGDYRLIYERYPHTIDSETEDHHLFEISEFAQTALPYFVAAQITAMEHDLRYHQLYQDEFAAILENVAAARKAGNLHLVSTAGWCK
ncbi:MAG: hypothetical protein IJN42_02565 [Clostridia bacterium]|nr:hypothetical protein [Clostridia bacterium]